MKDHLKPQDLQGIYAELADIIGVEKTFEVFNNLHGQTFIFPQHFYKPEYVAKAVKEEYPSCSCRELAKKYGYSERRIRQMLKKEN